jgi:[ribosomal protein S18]-alanine N-acetyltransferase
MSAELRLLDVDDLDAVERIERASYAAPWSRSMFVGELAKPGSLFLGAFRDDAELAAFLVVSRYVDAWHVMNLAVAPDDRRLGLATSLMQRLFELTADDGTRGYTLEVRVSNVAAIRLYERLGFKPKGVRRSYYTDNREDALVMWKGPEGDERP